MRFTRHESQATDEYDYVSYDASDRPFSMGTQVIPGMGTANVEQRDTPSGKTEQKGLIYDNLSTFQSRTGLLLSDILPLINVGLNGDGRVVCEYNLNKSVNLSSFSAKDRFVATFYNYNSYGEITDEYKYIGPVRNPDKRIHRVIFFYDNNHRLYQTMLQDNGATPLVTIQHYDFDPLGRIVKVTGASGKFYSSYSYYDWGGLKSVVMGGTGASNSGTRMDFNYHAQGWVKEVRATRQSTGEVEFQQILGYEDQVAVSSNIPGVFPKLDGSISQQLVKFAQDLDASSPIRVTNYQYDNLNRMLTADTRKSTGTPPWDTNKQIIFGSLQLTDTDDQDSRLTFDNNGRIATNRSGVAAADQATYAYQGNSYKLDHVSGKLNPDTQRDASPAGTFTYDARGRMTGDASKKLTMTYGWDDMPLQFDVDTGDSLYSDREFYDAQGTRVCRVRIKTQAKVWVPIFDGEMTILVKGYLSPDALIPKVVQSITDVNLLKSGDRRWVETYDDAGAIASSSGKSGVFGASAQIGELNSDGTYRYFVKNHLGSILRTVGEDGEYLDGSGSATDYMAYGTQKKLKMGSTEQVQSFTGKEQEDATGEYAFGARWYDSDLGLFMSVDPAGQYANPYSYGPSSPMNGSDPSGMMWDIFRPSKWAAAGREVNEYTEKAWNGSWFGGDECHYETNEHCRGRIEKTVSLSGAVNQLSENCGSGNSDACRTLSAIGYFQYGKDDNGNYSFETNWNRKLAVYIFENGGHKLGASLTVGGGKAAPAVQYDDKTIPLGVYDVSGKPSQQDIQANQERRAAALADYYATHESRPGYNVFAGSGAGVTQVEMYSPGMCMSECLDDPTVGFALTGLMLTAPGMSIPKFGRAATLSAAMRISPWTTPLSLAQYYFPVLGPGARQLGRTMNPVSRLAFPFFAGYLMGYTAVCTIECYDEPGR